MNKDPKTMKDDLIVEYSEKILKHVVDSYHKSNVWFTNVNPILREFAERVKNES